MDRSRLLLPPQRQATIQNWIGEPRLTDWILGSGSDLVSFGFADGVVKFQPPWRLILQVLADRGEQCKSVTVPVVWVKRVNTSAASFPCHFIAARPNRQNKRDYREWLKAAESELPSLAKSSFVGWARRATVCYLATAGYSRVGRRFTILAWQHVGNHNSLYPNPGPKEFLACSVPDYCCPRSPCRC